jgi:hypothetical protein
MPVRMGMSLHGDEIVMHMFITKPVALLLMPALPERFLPKTAH